jgi:uncharacterized protein YbcC (UPF0753/DUF2309 family)
LVSYDSKSDLDGSILKAHVDVIFRVCAGINLEYYFSFVDNEVFGAGGKQPHNVTSMMGVMTGYKSDLRLGLPWQMVEIHEPARIIIPIETEVKKFLKILPKLSKGTQNLILNEWVRVLIFDKGEVYLFKSGEMISVDQKITNDLKDTFKEVYLGKREILDFTKIRGL